MCVFHGGSPERGVDVRSNLFDLVEPLESVVEVLEAFEFFEFFQLLFKLAAISPALLSSAFVKLIDTFGTPDHLLPAVRDMARVATRDALDFSVLERAKLCHLLVEEGLVIG